MRIAVLDNDRSQADLISQVLTGAGHACQSFDSGKEMLSLLKKIADEALELVRKHQPDVLVADIAMPGLNGLDLVRRMGEESLPTQAVILSMHTDQEYVHRAIAAGAKGYVLKGSGIEVPNLKDYAWVIWDYWERHLDPALFIDHTLRGAVGGAGQIGRGLVRHP